MAKKNYKKYKEKYDKKSKGVGDTVEKITTATGIKKVVKFIAGDDSTITVEEQENILKIYNRVFKENVSTTSCSSCFVHNVWNKLKRIYKEYE